jgi:predicted flap endonuclease-1-like 5' DNA nuclease
LAAVAATIVWLTREHLLPTPHVTHEPPPHYRSTPPPPDEAADDLTAIKGIGPVYASRLDERGVHSFRALANADAATLATSLGISPNVAADWIAQASDHIS